MSDLDRKIANLKEDIHYAFGDLRYPGDSKLLHGNCQDNSDILKFYGQKDWAEVKDSIIEYENAALCFFSPEAYQFFLPRFLIYTLENYDSGYLSADNTIYSLVPSGDQSLKEFQESKYSLLTQGQIGCIKTFLQLCYEELADDLDADAISQAINYWQEK